MQRTNKSIPTLLGLVLIGCTMQAAQGQATLSLSAPPCVNTDTLVVNLDLVHSTPVAVGAQVFLQYDISRLTFVSAVPGDGPFTLEVFESVNTGLGTIDYAVGVPGGGTGASAPPVLTMARFTFTISSSAEACTVSDLVSFRASGPGGAPNRVSDDQIPGQAIEPLTRNDLPDIRIDQTAPVAVKNDDIDVCYNTIGLAEAAAILNSSASDTCPGALTVSADTTFPIPLNLCEAIVTVTFTDECGNVSNELTFPTRIDDEKPLITCPDNIIVTANTNECDAIVDYPPFTTTDNCDPTPVVTCSIQSGSVFLPGTTTVTCTAEDTCGNISDPCSFDVTVNLLPTTLTLASAGCQPNGQLVVDINMSNACKIVVGGQYFLQYDNTLLEFVSADPGDLPFTKEVYEFVNTTAGPGVGTIDYATGILDGGMGTTAPTTMARITFNVILDDCSTTNLITWRPSGPGGIPNRLSDDQVPAQPVLPLAVVDLPSVTLDITDPVITGVPADTTVECDAVPPAPPTLTALDICDPLVTTAILILDQQTPSGVCPQNYTIKRSWSATDACGNVGTATQIITVQDTTAPSVDPAPGPVTISCEDPLPVGPATLPASDNCDSAVTAATLNADQTTPGSCAGNYIVTRTWTATDACGNATTRTQIITVQDITPPTINCPGPVTVQCASLVPANDFAGGSATDNCGGPPSVMHVSDAISNQTCPNKYTITRTYRATDDCNNTAECTQTITVDDTTPPTISCPGPVTVQCASLIPANDFAGGSASDNCGATPNVIHVSDAISNQTCPNKYTITRTYRATDDCNNSAECTQTITVDDTTAPTINCPGPVTVQCATLVPATDFAGGSASDNCGATPGVMHVSDVISNQTCPNKYTITRTYRATDDCNNTAECTQTITVDDTTIPVITLNGLAVIHLQCNSGNYVEQGATWTDNCDGGPFAVTDITYSPSMPTNQNGVYTVHYNAVDACSNQAVEVTRTVIIENPTPTCNSPQPLVISCQCPAACVPATHPVIAAWLASAVPVDGCDNDAVIDSNDAPACFPIGITTVTWTVTDRDQVPPVPNTCSSTVTVVADTTAPTAAQGSIALCYGTIADANQAALDATSTLDDDCDPMNAGLTVTKSVFTSAAEACSTTIVIRVQDTCGNFTDYPYNTRVDATPPTATQGSISACYQTVAAANAAALAATTAPNDNCDLNPSVSLQTSATAGCATSVVIRVADSCGNFTDYTYNTRVDNVAPVASSTGPIAACYTTEAAAKAAALAVSSATDNCPGALTATATVFPDVGCSFDIFVDFVDSCGNTSNFLLYSTKIDNQAPTATQGTIDACYNTIAAANAAALAATTGLTDNCPPAPTKAIHTSAVEACSTSIVVRVSDGCGNFTDYTYNTRVDNTPPTATQGTIALCYQTVAEANQAALDATTALADNCDPAPGKVVQTTATVACTTAVVIRVTDSCGNFTDYTYNTRVDNSAPTATQGTIDGCYQTVAAANAAALAATTALTDDCDPAPGKAIQTSAMEACATSVVVRVSDSCGNFTDYSYNTRVDGTAPTITLCPSDINVHAAPGSCSSAPVTYSAAATDNCTGSPTITFNPPSGSTFGPGTHPVLVIATDECGNSSNCTFNVINDGMVEMIVEVELGGGVMAAATFTRGITFNLWNTTVDNVNPLHTTCVTMSFTGNAPSSATILVPCQPTGYDCITARDRLHTLRRTISPIPISGPAYAPSFTGAKALIGGNLNDDRFIDILDFGIYTTQDLTVAPGGANTVCGQNPPGVKHADITGNGLVNTLDYSFIANNFLMTRENNCGINPLSVVAGDGRTGARERDRPVTSITIAELQAQGLSELAVMDLNHDGVFNLSDRDLWLQGVRPTQAPAAPPSAPLSGKPIQSNPASPSTSSRMP